MDTLTRERDRERGAAKEWSIGLGDVRIRSAEGGGHTSLKGEEERTRKAATNSPHIYLFCSLEQV